MATDVATHDLDGVTVTRVPFSLPDFDGGRVIATVQFHAHSTRTAPTRLVLRFAGDNLKARADAHERARAESCARTAHGTTRHALTRAAACAARPRRPQLEALGPMQLVGTDAVRGNVPSLAKTALCAVGPLDLDSPFSYKVTIVAVPADPEPERVAELEGWPARPRRPEGRSGRGSHQRARSPPAHRGSQASSCSRTRRTRTTSACSTLTPSTSVPRPSRSKSASR